jgi:hypothetical protein
MGIIKKAQRKRMSEMTSSYLEDAKYNIKSASENEIIILSNSNNTQKLRIFLHNQRINKKKFLSEVNKTLRKGDYITNIFYKDGENFHVRLGGRSHFKGDNRSLKKYTNTDLNKMLHLRDLEKIVLRDSSPQNSLTYYQPETKILQEGFRKYLTKNVQLDYSHIGRHNKNFGFAKPGISKEYKIAQEVTSNSKNISFSPKEKGAKILITEPPRY